MRQCYEACTKRPTCLAFSWQADSSSPCRCSLKGENFYTGANRSELAISGIVRRRAGGRPSPFPESPAKEAHQFPEGSSCRGGATSERPTVQRVAVAYHGSYIRGPLPWHYWESDCPNPFRCSDAFESHRNIHSHVVEALRRAGVRTGVFFHSHRSGCSALDAELVRLLRPHAHEFSEVALPRIIDSYLRALQLVQTHGPDADAVLLLRFDVEYRVPITAACIDWSKVNIAFRDIASSWDSFRAVSDLFFVVPMRLLSSFARALDKVPR